MKRFKPGVATATNGPLPSYRAGKALQRLKTLDEERNGNWFPIATKNGLDKYCEECGARLPPFLYSTCVDCFLRADKKCQ